jgi:hypothetical protein
MQVTVRVFGNVWLEQPHHESEVEWRFSWTLVKILTNTLSWSLQTLESVCFIKHSIFSQMRVQSRNKTTVNLGPFKDAFSMIWYKGARLNWCSYWCSYWCSFWCSYSQWINGHKVNKTSPIANLATDNICLEIMRKIIIIFSQYFPNT